MKIEILGCSGSVMPGYGTTSILVDSKVLIDAGSVMSVLDPHSVTGIRAVLITHPHIDHIMELPFLVDALYMKRARGIRILGSPQTIDAIRAHVFNGLIWPDLAELDTTADFVTLESISGEAVHIDGIDITAFPVEHTRGAYGYVLSSDGGHVLFSGDTGYHEGLFALIKRLSPTLRACFIEASFPDRMENLARITQHLTPGLISRGLDGIVRPQTRVFVYHIKPAHIEEVMADLPAGFECARAGEVILL